ncbi:MAG: glycosyltransferase [Patescibacteria group bacterium]
MKILYIITQGEQGGAQKNVFDLATNMRREGHDVCVATGKQKSETDSWLLNNLDKNGFEKKKLIILNNLIRNISVIKDMGVFFETLFLIRKIKPDIVHLHSSKAGTICAVSAKILRVKVVYTVHGFVFLEPMSFIKKIFYIIAEFIASFFRDKTITVSKYDMNIGRKFKIIRGDKGLVVYNGLDLNKKKLILDKEQAVEFISDKICKKIDNNTKIIGVIANLYKTKGLNYLIRAFYKIRKQNKNIIIVVFGEGYMRKNIESLIKKLNLINCFFLPGTVTDAYKYLRGFDLTILPSIKEGFPYAILESMLAEVPVMATNVGGISEISEELNKNLIKPADVDDLFNKIMSFIKQEKINRIKLPEKFILDNIIKQILKCYKEIYD